MCKNPPSWGWLYKSENHGGEVFLLFGNGPKHLFTNIDFGYWCIKPDASISKCNPRCFFLLSLNHGPTAASCTFLCVFPWWWCVLKLVSSLHQLFCLSHLYSSDWSTPYRPRKPIGYPHQHISCRVQHKKIWRHSFEEIRTMNVTYILCGEIEITAIFVSSALEVLREQPR